MGEKRPKMNQQKGSPWAVAGFGTLRKAWQAWPNQAVGLNSVIFCSLVPERKMCTHKSQNTIVGCDKLCAFGIPQKSTGQGRTVRKAWQAWQNQGFGPRATKNRRKHRPGNKMLKISFLSKNLPKVGQMEFGPSVGRLQSQ